jgi:aryl-alcohol dehydrogenase-like predicted oxidoreductase
VEQAREPTRLESLDVLRHAVAEGVNHIDTAQFYGPDVANELIHAALYPYPEELVLVSKAGSARLRRHTRGPTPEAATGRSTGQPRVVAAGPSARSEIFVAIPKPGSHSTNGWHWPGSCQRSPNLLLIPRTSSLTHLRENLEAAELELDTRAIDAIA